jgi:O-antigen/teichoic acid export membrane protein
MKSLYSKIQYARHSSFLSGVGVLISGATLAHLIPLIALPFFARIYPSEAFATQALLATGVLVLFALSSGCYELAIPIPRSKKRAAAIATLAMLLCTVFCVLLMGVLVLCQEWMTNVSPLAALKQWVFAIPISIFTVTLTVVCNYWLLRDSKFYHQSLIKIIVALTTALAVGVCSVMHIESGLLVGFVVGQCLGSIASYSIAYRFGLRFGITRYYARYVLYHYRQFPFFSSIPSVINNLAIQLPLVLITHHYTLAQAGNFAVVRGLFAAGMMMVYMSVGQVTMKHIAERAQRRQPIWPYFRKVALTLFAVCVGMMVMLQLFADWFFALYLGERWTDASWIGHWLAATIVFGIMGPALANALLALKQVRMVALWQCCYGALSCLLFLVNDVPFEQFVRTVALLEIAAFLIYVVLISWTIYRHDGRARTSANPTLPNP